MSKSLEPTISVVITTFNRAHMVADAIQSAIGQLLAPMEIIIVDDGSTDSTEHIVNQLKPILPLRYYRRPHSGQAASNNFGVSMARGNWIAFLDSDDVWYPNKLAVQVDRIKTHTDVPFFYSDMDYVQLDGAGREHRTGRGWNSILIPLIFNGQPNAHVPTVLLRTDVFLNEGGFNPTLEHGESWELFARIAAKYPIHYIAQTLAKQRLHPGQITKDLRLKAATYHRFHSCLLKLWNEDAIKRSALIRDTARVYADLGKHFLQIGDYEYARKCFWRSLSYERWSLRNWRRLGLSYVPGARRRYLPTTRSERIDRVHETRS